MRKVREGVKLQCAGLAAIDASVREDHVSMVMHGRTSRVMACGPEASQTAN